MSKKTKQNIQPVNDIIDQLNLWSDEHNGYLVLAVSSDKSENSYTTLCSVQGQQGDILAGLQDLIRQYPRIAELLSIALHHTEQHKHYS